MIFLSVPVYDGRLIDSKFEWTAQVFENLDDHFMMWNGEVPLSSFAIIGYSVQFFKANDKLPAIYRNKAEEEEDMWKIYNYIQWVIVLGTPPGWMDPVHGWVEGDKLEGN